MSSKQIGTVYLNPKFKNIHINPKFIQPVAENQQKPNKIHINPNFMKIVIRSAVSPSETPILCTRTKLIRSVKPSTSTQVADKPAASSLKKIGLRKLIRTDLKRNSIKENPVAVASQDGISKFKLDRRGPYDVNRRQSVILTRFRLKRLSTNDILSPRKVSVSRFRLRRIGSTKKDDSQAMKLLNINGVFYKSVANSSKISSTPSSSRGNNTLYIRGEKFLVTGNGNRLQRAPDSTSKTVEKRKRIDIGGCTFVANDKGTFERTNSHVVRSYISQAKQRSLHILTNQFKKNNIPCMIYRRLGKCLSHERGKCAKVHNPDQVAVCKNFLKGKCTKSDCLLSHKISLTKMPTCHFFLNGCCTTVDCPYLHKKINRNVDICPDFLTGFCVLAEKCPKRHEFNQISNSEIKRSHKKIAPQVKNVLPVAPTEKDKRYYGDEKREKYSVSESSKCIEDAELDMEVSDEEPSSPTPKRRRRPPIGTLPAFIPL